MRLALLCVALAGCAGHVTPDQPRTAIHAISQLSQRFANSNEASAIHVQQSHTTDSAYVRLLKDFGDIASFSYAAVSSGGAESDVVHRITDVSIDGCTLSYDDWTNRYTSTNRVRVVLPLTAIDPASFRIQVRRPKGDSHFEPVPWILHFKQKSSSRNTPITSTESRRTENLSQLEIEFDSRDKAVLVQNWLTDGARQCPAWKSDNR
jgi:hypothetical protein